MSKNQDILLEVKHRCGLVTLNRPKALNALNYDMIAQMEAHYIEWAGNADIYGVVLQSSGGRAFCSGGDLKALYTWWKTGKLGTILEKYSSEYQFNWTLDRFTKPHVSLMDGYVFGSGVGISLYGTHKVAGENYRFAMPEACIGFFPDVGASYFLPRMPGQIGLYLALTGNQIDRADAYALGLLTHCIDASEFDAIIAAMCDADPIDPVLDGRHVDPGPSTLLEMQERIDKHFSGESVEEIVASLQGDSGTDADWAKETAVTIARNSPLSLKVSYRQVRNSGQPTLEEALELEGGIARAFLTGEEFYEGIRALLIDKDAKPNWSPATLEEVSDEMVEACFAPDEGDGFKPINPFA
jgi:enoyl-CoA hydratase